MTVTKKQAEVATQQKWILKDELFILQNLEIQPNWTPADVFNRDKKMTVLRAKIEKLNNIIEEYLTEEMKNYKRR